MFGVVSVLLCFSFMSRVVSDEAPVESAHETCPTYSHYIYHGGKKGQVFLNCGYESVYINVSSYAVCDESSKSVPVLHLPSCPQMRTFLVLTTGDQAEYHVAHHSGYKIKVPDIPHQRTAIESYFRTHSWVLAVDDNVLLVCGQLKYMFFLKEGTIARCFGPFLDPNHVVQEVDHITIGKKDQVFFYYNFVINTDLSNEQQTLVDAIMDTKPVFYRKTWYLSAVGGFFMNCADITLGGIYDSTLERQEWQPIGRANYARCNGLNILIDNPRYGDIVWVIKSGLYVQGREEIILENYNETAEYEAPAFVSTKDDMFIKCGSYTYAPRQNDVLSCKLSQTLQSGQKLNIIEGIEGVTYYYPIEMYMSNAEDFYANSTGDKYLSYDVINAGSHFGLQEELVLQIFDNELPSSMIEDFNKASFRGSEETQSRIRYFGKHQVSWKPYP